MITKYALLVTIASTFTMGLLSCNSADQQQTPADTTGKTKPDTVVAATPSSTKPATPEEIENRISDTIFKLPEIQERNRYIEEQTKGERHLKIWMNKSDDGKGLYWVNAGEDNGSNLVSHFQFQVDPATLHILYQDIANDTLLELADWRKTKTD